VSVAAPMTYGAAWAAKWCSFLKVCRWMMWWPSAIWLWPHPSSKQPTAMWGHLR